MHAPPYQPGLILPSWWNVRQKAAVATLCTLWSWHHVQQDFDQIYKWRRIHPLLYLYTGMLAGLGNTAGLCCCGWADRGCPQGQAHIQQARCGEGCNNTIGIKKQVHCRKWCYRWLNVQNVFSDLWWTLPTDERWVCSRWALSQMLNRRLCVQNVFSDLW